MYFLEAKHFPIFVGSYLGLFFYQKSHIKPINLIYTIMMSNYQHYQIIKAFVYLANSMIYYQCRIIKRFFNLINSLSIVTIHYCPDINP